MEKIRFKMECTWREYTRNDEEIKEENYEGRMINNENRDKVAR